ncbi:MAG: hypothetical protein QW840_02160 [Candidatus Bathyarchaeia archaeon]
MALEKIHAGIILAVGMTGLLMTVLATSLLTASQQIPNAGIVKALGVGVYEDAACSKNVTSINWGVIDPGTTASFLVYIRNEGNTRMKLNMTTLNWNPSKAAQYISLSWNRENYILNSMTTVQANLTLSVASNIEEVTTFLFDIIITGIEYP